jgi:two-component system response regulator EvgA
MLMQVLETPTSQTCHPLPKEAEARSVSLWRGRPTLRNVLVIDDDPDYRVWIRVLVGTKYRVLERESGDRADASLCQGCSLVILDLVMPDGEGLETLQRLRGAGVTTKILAVSGADHGDTYLMLARRLGADAIASKQTAPVELRRVIRNLLLDAAA